MVKRICTIHDTTKPAACKNWPHTPQDIKSYENCTLYFEGGILKGDCCQCGECCLTPWITPPGYNRKYRDERCPYLQDVD